MHFELIKKYSKTVKIVFTILLLFVLLDLLFPLPQKKEFSKEIHAKNGTLLSAYLTRDDKWRLRTELEEVSPELIKAIIEKEDSWFYWHFGINPVSIVSAFYRNITSGETQLRASTITMQVARMLEPKKRTYLNKLGEIFRVMQLEIRYSKEEILELSKLSERIKSGLKITAVSTSQATTKLAVSLGIRITKLNEVEDIDLTIDGADEVDEKLNGKKEAVVLYFKRK